MLGFRVLVVCVGNICRSPLGERLLAARLPEGFTVSSAGIGAVVGSPMDPQTAELARAYGVSSLGFAARQLSPRLVEESDLVLTATRAVRAAVLEEVPSALRRTFTVLEYAALLDLVEDGTDSPDPAATTRAAAAERARVALDDYDIADPYRRGPEAHAEAARVLAAAVDRIAKGLSR